MDAVRVEHFISRATDFIEGMKLVRLDDSYMNSAALLAIHAAISYSDALRAGLSSPRLHSDDHAKAADELERLLLPRGLEDTKGFMHLRGLLARKSLVSYGDRRLTTQDFRDVITRSERFVRWANATGKELQIKGWRDAN